MSNRKVKASRKSSRIRIPEQARIDEHVKTDALARVQARRDGMENALTGIGRAERDKRLATGICPPTEYQWTDVMSLWRGDDMAAKAIEVLPQEMMRAGFEVRVSPDDKDADADDAPDRSAPARAQSPNANDFPASAAQPGTGITAPRRDARFDADEMAQLRARHDALCGCRRRDCAIRRGVVRHAQARLDAFVGATAGGSAPAPFSVVPGAPPMPEKPSVKPIDKPDTDAERDVAEACDEEWKRLHGFERFLDALMWARAYGGSAIILGVSDGETDLSQPLDLSKVRSFDFATTVMKSELYPIAWYNDPGAEKYGEVEVWRFVPQTVPTTALTGNPSPDGDDRRFRFVAIHETRLIHFRGRVVNRMHARQQQGHGDSIFVAIFDALRDFNLSWSSAAILLQDFAQAVFKMKGLAQLAASNQEDVIVKRAALVDMTRSVARSVLVDADGEDFERKSTPTTGLPDLLDRFAKRFAASIETPIEKLMGESPAGLNATGDSTIRFWYDFVDAVREARLTPMLRRFFEVVFAAKNGPTRGRVPANWTIAHNALWQLPEDEQATTRFTQAQTDQIYIANGVISPEECAASRFGGDEYSTETKIDYDGRQEAQDQYAKDAKKAAADQAQKIADAGARQASPTDVERRGPGQTPTAGASPAGR